AAGSSRKMVSICSLMARNMMASMGSHGFRLDHRRPGAGRHRGKHVFLPFNQCGGVVAGNLEPVTMSDGIGGTGFHAITAEDAAVVIDVVNAGVAFAA